MSVAPRRQRACAAREPPTARFGYAGRVTAPAGGERIGEIVDSRYQIVSAIGRGGMGSVYRAEHIAIKRAVAIKLLNPEFAKVPQINERFRREAIATGRVEHPNCVGIIDSGTLSDGTTYLVMELLSGRSLGSEIERVGRIEPARALRIARHILRGLAHAHRAGVVHRDLKPENIYLIERPDCSELEFAKVLDFGIAKLVGDALEQAGGQQLTQTGISVGSPRYLAPEQATGDDIDARTDLYSLTVVLFEMLTGRRPFESDQGMEVVRMHLLKDPPSLAEVAPDLRLPADLEALVAKGLAKSKPLRFASADEYLAAVERALAALAPRTMATPSAPMHSPTPTPVPVRPAGGALAMMATVPSVPVQGRPRRNVFVALGAAAAVAVIAAIAWPRTDGREPATEASAAAATAVSAESDATAGDEPGDSDDDTTMIFDVDDAAAAEQPVDPGLDMPGREEIESLLRRGAKSAAKKRLVQLRKKNPQNAHLAYWLGRLYFADHWWQDGFEQYRDAVRLDRATYGAKKEVIIDATRCFISLNQSWRARDFLVEVIGDPAIPYLETIVAKAKNRNVRRRATETLRRLAP